MAEIESGNGVGGFKSANLFHSPTWEISVPTWSTYLTNTIKSASCKVSSTYQVLWVRTKRFGWILSSQLVRLMMVVK